jgi:ABC-type sugar transport system permease subunit
MPHDIYEAAVLDKANAFNRFKYVTSVWIRPILRLNVIYQTIMALIAFDLIYVITSGGPFDITSTLSFFTYREAFQFFNWGNAFALSIILFIIGICLVYVYIKALPEVRYQ